MIRFFKIDLKVSKTQTEKLSKSLNSVKILTSCRKKSFPIIFLGERWGEELGGGGRGVEGEVFITTASEEKAEPQRTQTHVHLFSSQQLNH